MRSGVRSPLVPPGLVKEIILTKGNYKYNIKGEYMDQIISFIYEQFKWPNIILTIVGIITFYNFIFLIIGFIIKPKKFPETNNYKKYGILIAARNEELVIGQLIDSILNQDYPKDKIEIFVVADNCSDNTYKLAKSKGVKVYERNNLSKQRKGYALDFLLQNINKDYGIKSFDGYIVFDADNLLDKDFVKEINKAFVINKNAVRGYLNTKNFDTNFITSAYSIHFYRSVVAQHRPRQFLKLGTHINGTGILIASHLLKDGWKYHSLTEDAELTAHLTSKHIKVEICEQAIFFDEQPDKFKFVFRQRVRWEKGRMLVFFKYFFKMFGSIFRYFSFTSYDLLVSLIPWGLFSFIRYILVPIIIGVIFGSLGSLDFWHTFFMSFITLYIGLYFYDVFLATLVVIKERKNIHASLFQKIKGIITYPWFNIISMYIAFYALIHPKVKWKSITHTDIRTIEDVDDIKQKTKT